MTVTHLQNLRQLAEREDEVGAFARGRLALAQVSEALVGELGRDAAAEWWRAAADTIDDLDAELKRLLREDRSAGAIGALGDKLRAVASVIEEADL